MQICIVCKNNFFRPKHLKQKTCSIKCRGKAHATHGDVRTRFYVIWLRMNRVCYKKTDPRYKLYGKRGIKCLWSSYKEFKDDMFSSYEKHLKTHGKLNTTIERIDNDGNYCKENCRWATRKEQARNRRNRVTITYNGETHSITEWAEILNLPRGALWLRLKRFNWTVEKSFNTPILHKYSNG